MLLSFNTMRVHAQFKTNIALTINVQTDRVEHDAFQPICCQTYWQQLKWHSTAEHGSTHQNQSRQLFGSKKVCNYLTRDFGGVHGKQGFGSCADWLPASGEREETRQAEVVSHARTSDPCQAYKETKPRCQHHNHFKKRCLKNHEETVTNSVHH